MLSNIFGFCCTNRTKDDMDHLPYDARDVLNNNPGLGEVFKMVKQVEDHFLC